MTDGATQVRTVTARPRRRAGSFFRRVIIVLTTAHLPFVVAAGEAAGRAGIPHPWLLALALAVCSAVAFVMRARLGMGDRRRSAAVVHLVDVPLFIHWCACLFALIPSAAALLVSPLVDLVRGAPVTPPSAFIMWTYAVGLALSAYGTIVRRRWFVVDEVDIPVRGLDPRLDGLRIAHLSDLHIGAMTPRSWAERWTRAANARRPDVAVITGDLVTSGADFHEDIADVVATLDAPLGVFVSMGNHDYFGDGEPLVSLLRSRGAAVLRNEGRVVERAGAPLFLAGIDDTWTRRDDIDRALADRPAGVPVVLLAHDPARFGDSSRRGVAVTLSGHTHGGQVAVPFLYRWLSLSHIAHEFHVGLYRRGDSVLYVHPGLGTTGPPLRLGIAPAVVIHTLRAA